MADVVAPILGWTAADVDREVETYTARVEAEVLSQAQPDDASADALRASAPEARAEILEPVPLTLSRAPLPPRDGLGPARLRVRGGALGVELTRFGPDVAAKAIAGEVVDQHGAVLDPATVLPAGASVYLYRDLRDEVPVPFDIPVLHRDEDIVVVDKPHFLATMPRGRHVAQTALVRLRRELDLPELSPAHRLDRLTAGVLLFTTRREVRGAYQTLFARAAVHKTYVARAPVNPDVALPRVVRSRIIKRRGHLQAVEEPGEPNAETLVELLSPDGLYRLTPRTWAHPPAASAHGFARDSDRRRPVVSQGD